jgi:hypothetical protein
LLTSILIASWSLVRFRPPFAHASSAFAAFAGCRGTLVSIPVHPVTWYECKLDHGPAIKVRRSAFDLCTPDSVASSAATAAHEPPAFFLDELADGNSATEDEDDDTASSFTGRRSRLAVGSMIGKDVVVESGKHVGRVGHVLRGANGYLHLQLYKSDDPACVDGALIHASYLPPRKLRSGISSSSFFPFSYILNCFLFTHLLRMLTCSWYA